jgi:hypothetical protein
MFAYFGRNWTGSGLQQLRYGWGLHFGTKLITSGHAAGPMCGEEDLDLEHRVLVTAGTDADLDGEPDSWTIEAGPVDLDGDGTDDLNGHARLCDMGGKGPGSAWRQVAEVVVPFKMTLVRN